MGAMVGRRSGQLLLVVLLVLPACSSQPDVAAEELRQVVARDAVVFEGAAIPDSFVERVATNRAVVLGETHHLQEHWAFVASLLAELNEDEPVQLLREGPHMQDWLINDWVRGSALAPNWEAPPYFERRFAAIRALNAALPPDRHITVRSIDANEDHYGGGDDFRLLVGWLVDALGAPQPIVGAFLAAPYASESEQIAAIDALMQALGEQRDTLSAAWGEEWLDHIIEMLEIERVSAEIRALRVDDDDSAARAREDVLKDLADRRIDGFPGLTVINIGAHHAQKVHLMGTDQEWLGDYLVHRSPVVGGDAFIVGFTSAVTELLPGAGGTPWDVVESSPEYEIYRIVAESFPGSTVYLPLDDPMFSERTVAMNSEEIIYLTRLNDQFDGIIQYGLAHRWPIE
jgi:hypothetical protein